MELSKTLKSSGFLTIFWLLSRLTIWFLVLVKLEVFLELRAWWTPHQQEVCWTLKGRMARSVQNFCWLSPFFYPFFTWQRESFHNLGQRFTTEWGKKKLVRFKKKSKSIKPQFWKCDVLRVTCSLVSGQKSWDSCMSDQSPDIVQHAHGMSVLLPIPAWKHTLHSIRRVDFWTYIQKCICNHWQTFTDISKLKNWVLKLKIMSPIQN